MDKKVELSNILPFVDLFVGGGGTINIEATFWNIPTISTRSFLCFYDRYLIEEGLMFHGDNETLKNLINRLLNEKNRKVSKYKKQVDIIELIEKILE
jgi:predicted glycosyltransferase